MCSLRQTRLLSVTINVEHLLSAQEIAAHLGMKTKTVYVWVSKKRMPAHKVGRLWKFKVSEVNNWVQSGKAAQKK